MSRETVPRQLLHLVFGGEHYATAHAAWQAKAQARVDNAHVRDFVLEPDAAGTAPR